MRTLLFICFWAVSSVVAFAAGHQVKNIDSLHAFNGRFNQLVSDGNADGLVGLYSQDTVWIEQGKPATQGLEEPRKLFNFVTTNKGEIRHTVDNLFVADDSSLAVMIGSVDAKMEKIGMDATGTYLYVLKPDGDSWKVVTDMWHQHSSLQGEEK